MYPIFRYAKEMAIHGRKRNLGLADEHISHHICWPWDVDLWMELNNGRTLTLYDLGRVPMTGRNGIQNALKDRGWSMAVAGASIRYRRRVRMFQRVTMKSKVLGWDARFFYFQQSMWRKGEATSSILLRMAMTDENGILPPANIAGLIDWPETSPDLPDYVLAWIKAEAARPWPPQT